jgi:hypothetical protein
MPRSEGDDVVTPARELVDKALIAIGRGKDSFSDAKARFKTNKKEAQAAGKPIEAIKWAGAMIFLHEAKLRWEEEARKNLKIGDRATPSDVEP